MPLDNVTGYHVGGTINIDTGDGGDNLESRTITAIGTSGITFTPALSRPHSAGATVTGSGNNLAASDPSAGAAVTPRLIARLEISYTTGSSDVIVSDRSWRTALGPLVTDAWYSGSDHDARREQPGWDSPAPTSPPPPSAATARPWSGPPPASLHRRTSPPSWSRAPQNPSRWSRPSDRCR
ncbi:alpha-L-rhamnosidase N-terminal domain-containing protein [Nonomuraea rubra]|uniref:alpha-L-rhamnosidase N-terminal domain-containing protein n=1 Tax=Nonomuraea rubra TaxID=46180 RepID=UPI00361679E8